jgi:hypothetical protein
VPVQQPDQDARPLAAVGAAAERAAAAAGLGPAVSDEELIESISWHFQVGCLSLLGYQLTEHKARGSCAACRDRADLQADQLQCAAGISPA